MTHPPVIARFLEYLPPIVHQASKDLCDLPVLRDELRLLSRGAESNTRSAIELQNVLRDLEKKTTLANRLKVELYEAKTKI